MLHSKRPESPGRPPGPHQSHRAAVPKPVVVTGNAGVHIALVVGLALGAALHIGLVHTRMTRFEAGEAAAAPLRAAAPERVPSVVLSGPTGTVQMPPEELMLVHALTGPDTPSARAVRALAAAPGLVGVPAVVITAHPENPGWRHFPARVMAAHDAIAGLLPASGDSVLIDAMGTVRLRFTPAAPGTGALLRGATGALGASPHCTQMRWMPAERAGGPMLGVCGEGPAHEGRRQAILRDARGHELAGGALRDGLRDGRWHWKHATGAVYEEAHYVDGLLDGTVRAWHQSGELAFSARFVRGQLVGRWAAWAPGGLEVAAGTHLSAADGMPAALRPWMTASNVPLHSLQATARLVSSGSLAAADMPR